MEDSSQHQDYRKRSIVSIFSLFFQSGYTAALGLVANLVLTILLSPHVFGIYITILSLISFLNYFSDIGLAASLIQKKTITQDDVKTTFTIQQLLIALLLAIGFFATSFIVQFYSLPPEGVLLYWSLLAAFFISSLKTIPSVFLERKIQFQKIVIVQIVENTLFYITVMILALLNFGLLSFAIAVLVRAIAGLILIYYFSFWLPRFGVSRSSFKQLISFGLPFQASSFLAIFKDDFIILYLGKALGFEAVGYIGWAKKWAEAPLRIIMDNVTKVIFPLIARFQDDKTKISRLTEKLFYYQTAILAPTMVAAAFAMASLTQILPRYEKWVVALPLFYIFCLSSFIVALSAPLMNIFNALGKVKYTFSFMAFWTLLMWGLTPLFTSLFGMYGFPMAHLIVSTSGLLIVHVAQRKLGFNLIKTIHQFVLAALTVILVLINLKLLFVFNSLSYLLTTIALTGILYYLITRYIFNINLIEQCVQIFILRNKKELE